MGTEQLRQDRLEQKLNNALARLEKEQGDVQTKTTDTLISFGVAAVGVFFRGKSFSASNIGRATTRMRRIGRVAKEKSDVRRVAQDVEEIPNALQELAGEIEDKAGALTDSFSVENYGIETFAVKLRRSDILDVRMVPLWKMVV